MELLPHELIKLVTDFLPRSDLWQFRLVSKYWCNHVSALPYYRMAITTYHTRLELSSEDLLMFSNLLKGESDRKTRNLFQQYQAEVDNIKHLAKLRYVSVLCGSLEEEKGFICTCEFVKDGNRLAVELLKEENFTCTSVYYQNTVIYREIDTNGEVQSEMGTLETWISEIGEECIEELNNIASKYRRLIGM